MMAFSRITLALLLCAAAAVQAQDEQTEEPIEVRRYTVEMIIFRYAQDVSTGNEQFLAEEQAELTLDEDAILIDGERLEEIAPASRIYRDIEFTLLANDDLTMGEIESRLRRLDAYEPMMHFAWTQATWPDEDTLPIELSRFGRPPPQLTGTLRLYLSRFLHLVVDLDLQAPGQRSRSGVTLSRGNDRSNNESGPTEGRGPSSRVFDSSPPPPVHYRIDENRIFKSGDLRYFDHPKFGVLAKITRVEEQTEEALEPAETELLGYPAE